MSAQGQQAAPLQTGDLGPLMALIPEGYHDTLKEIAFFIFEELVSQAPDENHERLAGFALNSAEKLSQEYGGSQLYIPNQKVSDMRRKYAAIRRDFRGNNYFELSKKHDVSESRIRQIVKRRVKK